MIDGPSKVSRKSVARTKERKMRSTNFSFHRKRDKSKYMYCCVIESPTSTGHEPSKDQYQVSTSPHHWWATTLPTHTHNTAANDFATDEQVFSMGLLSTGRSAFCMIACTSFAVQSLSRCWMPHVDIERNTGRSAHTQIGNIPCHSHWNARLVMHLVLPKSFKEISSPSCQLLKSVGKHLSKNPGDPTEERNWQPPFLFSLVRFFVRACC